VKADEAGEEDACLVRVLVRPLGGGLVGGEKREGEGIRFISTADLVDFCIAFEEYECRPVKRPLVYHAEMI
jgi:hypothetical protein